LTPFKNNVLFYQK